MLTGNPSPRFIVTRKINQIQNVIDRLKSHPDCRRLMFSAWNAGKIEDMALPPCHSLVQFWTRELGNGERTILACDRGYKLADGSAGFDDTYMDVLGIPKRALSCQLYQRSCDVPLGVPFNIVQYSLLTHMLAQCVGMVAERFVWIGGDTHCYSNQWDGIREQQKRTFMEPTAWVQLNPEIKNIFDFTADDIEIKDYQSHPAIKFPKAAV